MTVSHKKIGKLRNGPSFASNKVGQNFENHTKRTLASTLIGPYVNQKNTFHQHKPQTKKANTA